MKTIFSRKMTQWIGLVGLVLLSNACDKSISEPTYDAYTPTALDANGGTWKTYVLTSATDIEVMEPKATTSTEYQAELQELKTTAAQLSQTQREAVTFWSAGGVYRWHEIARTLAANYNLPPVFNEATGKYPVPDAANPKADPKFPFTNPPYAARVFAYLAVAQYDALVATWNYKYKFNRMAPGKVDASLKSLVPVSDLPAYPSEDAVVAVASAEILKLMFPGEVEKLDAQCVEHVNSRLWAGANVRSDVDAGTALGKAVAARIIARAKADGMGAANNQTLVAGMITAAKERGLTMEWKSLETPARPPMLPNYGAVKLWNFSTAERNALRPVAPPAIGSSEMEKDLNELRGFAKNSTREQKAIASYWSDGVGSYTPPGHWNRAAARLTRQYKHNELRAARTLALTMTAVEDAGVCCWDTKFYYFTARPFQVDPSIRSTIGTPNFPGYTSGHSTFSGAAATILSHLFPSESADLDAKAKEASESRIYGCIHFRADCEAGLKCGANIAAYAVKRAQADGATN
ncbi:MAG: phosphatase PAP2 family protein [Cytophagaceae bacterium]|nr:phosphatase PAP2 family protein [Cytophagaceae bacterium]